MSLKKAIIINGLARGGTNILWNIIQSHPNIVSPMLETSELIGERSKNKFYFNLLSKLYLNNVLKSECESRFNKYLEAQKIKTLTDNFNKYKNITTTYTETEIQSASICFKGVSNDNLWDLKYSKLIEKLYKETYHIYLIKNGYSVCESWMRRGMTAKQAGYNYSKFCEEIIKLEGNSDKHKIVKFESILSDPFKESELLFDFCNEAPVKLDFIRLKVKKTIDKSNKFGELNSKYWFSKSNINELLNTNINSLHIKKLSLEDKSDFTEQAKEFLDYFGYLKD